MRAIAIVGITAISCICADIIATSSVTITLGTDAREIVMIGDIEVDIIILTMNVTVDTSIDARMIVDIAVRMGIVMDCRRRMRRVAAEKGRMVVIVEMCEIRAMVGTPGMGVIHATRAMNVMDLRRRIWAVGEIGRMDVIVATEGTVAIDAMTTDRNVDILREVDVDTIDVNAMTMTVTVIVMIIDVGVIVVIDDIMEIVVAVEDVITIIVIRKYARFNAAFVAPFLNAPVLQYVGFGGTTYNLK